MIDRAEILNVINEVEDRFPVDQWTVGGLHVWPLVRMTLANMLIDGKKGIGRQSESRFERLKRLARQVSRTYCGFIQASVADCRKNAPASSPARVVFLGDGVSFVQHKDYYYDRFCEPLIDFLNTQSIDSLFISRCNYYHYPRHNPSKWIQPQMDWIRLKAKFTGTSSIQGSAQLPCFDEFFDWFRPRFPFVTKGRFNLESSVFLIQQMADYFLEVFRKIRPAFAVTAEYYGLDNFAYNLACRRFEIPCLEIQHGMQGVGNPHYARWYRHPPEGYEFFPAIFWVWSDYECQSLKDWTSRFPNCPEVVIGCNNYLDIWLEGEQAFTKQYDPEINRIKQKFPDKKHILVALQGRKQMGAAELDLLRRALEKTRDTHVWWFRMHPTFMNELKFFQDCFGGFGHVIDIPEVSRLPLYNLLGHMDLHMTHHSSTVIEAAEFGVGSVIFGKQGRDSYPDQIESGMAFYTPTPEDMVTAIDTLCQKRVPVEALKKKAAERLRLASSRFLNLVNASFSKKL